MWRNGACIVLGVWIAFGCGKSDSSKSSDDNTSPAKTPATNISTKRVIAKAVIAKKAPDPDAGISTHAKKPSIEHTVDGGHAEVPHRPTPAKTAKRAKVVEKHDETVQRVVALTMGARPESSYSGRDGRSRAAALGRQISSIKAADLGRQISSIKAGRNIGQVVKPKSKLPGSRTRVGRVRGADSKNLTAAIVRLTIQRRFMNGLRSCHELALTRDPAASGKVSLKFTVRESGRVGRIAANGFNVVVDKCIQKRGLRWRFRPKPKDQDGAPIPATYRLTIRMKSK